MGLPQPTSLTKEQIEAKMVEHEGQLTKPLLELAREAARREGISLAGITILGGKIYVNVTGLDTKIKMIEKEKGWVKAGVQSECLIAPTEENDYRAKYRVTITMFDKTGFDTSIKLIKPKDRDVIELLKNTYLMPFTMEGSASIKSVKMSTMKNADFIEMMAERRASNRAKREITGCGLTSVEEMDVAPEIVLPAPQGESPGIIPDPPEQPEESKSEINMKPLLAAMGRKVIDANEDYLKEAEGKLPEMNVDQANRLMDYLNKAPKEIEQDDFWAKVDETCEK